MHQGAMWAVGGSALLSLLSWRMVSLLQSSKYSAHPCELPPGGRCAEGAPEWGLLSIGRDFPEGRASAGISLPPSLPQGLRGGAPAVGVVRFHFLSGTNSLRFPTLFHADRRMLSHPLCPPFRGLCPLPGGHALLWVVPDAFSLLPP